MSGILGIWNTDGAPVHEGLLLRMNDRLKHRGPDGASHLLRGNAGFAYQSLNVTPESLGEHQPFVGRRNTVVLLDGRIDNRAELLHELKHAYAVSAQSPDVDLVAAAYEAYGEGFAGRLDGDFAAAVFDAARTTLLLARDAIGMRALNYCRFGDCILFASEIKALLLHPAVKTGPNKDSLAEFLFRHWDYRDETNTYFTDISAVPPARVVRLTPERTTLSRHFDFDARRTLRLPSQQQYLEAYQEAFFRAVKNRMRSVFPTAVTVSGGLDSSSIFCTADALSKRGEAISPFFGIAQVGEHPRANEIEFQQAVEEKCGRTLVKHSVGRLTCLQDARAKIWHAEGPFLIADVWQDIFADSQRRGARVLLSGHFGDHVLMNPQYILDLFLRGRWPTAYRCAQGYCSDLWFPVTEFDIDPSELRRELFANLKSYLMPEFLRPTYHRLRHALFHKDDRQAFYSEEFHQVYEAFVSRSRRGTLPSRSRAHAKALYHSVNSKNYQTRLERDAKAIGQFSMEIAYPFYDRELVALVMSMPGEAVCPDGVSRGIHREAMKGILPEKLRNRRSKGDFASMGKQGALQDFGHLEACIMQGAAAKWGLLKPTDALKADLAVLKAALGDEAETTALAFWKTWDLMEAELFLRVFFGDGENAVVC